MNAASAINFILSIQGALHVIDPLQIYSYLWSEQAAVKDGDFFDFIIVGGGTAGCVMAARLAEDHKTKVLLVEAGGNPPMETNIPSLLIYLGQSHVDWKYTTASDCNIQMCHRNPRLDLNLGKMIGGSGSLDYLVYAEGNSNDYDQWASIVGDDNWSWANVAPYFAKTFRLDPKSANISGVYYSTDGKVGLSGNTEVLNEVYLNGFKQAGNKIVPLLNGNQTTGYSRALYTIAEGMHQSTAYKYLSPMRDYPNLFVLRNTEAKSILFNTNKKAVGVELVTETKQIIKVKCRKEVIVSAGTINSPKLLMLSGIGPKEDLQKKGIKVISDLPVGDHFQDHIGTIIIHNMTTIPEPSKSRDSREYPANVILGSVNLNKTKENPEYSTVNYINYARFLSGFCAFTYGLSSKICDALFDHPNTNQMIFSIVTLLEPKSRGKVILKSANYTDPPIVSAGYFSNEEDLENLVKYIEDFVRVTKTPSFIKAGGKLVNPELEVCADYKFGTTEYWWCYARCTMTTRRHYVGTNSMGKVVDSQLRVKGVKRLRVVDASVMPIVTGGGTYAATIVVGEKAAEFVKKDHNL